MRCEEAAAAAAAAEEMLGVGIYIAKKLNHQRTGIQVALGDLERKQRKMDVANAGSGSSSFCSQCNRKATGIQRA